MEPPRKLFKGSICNFQVSKICKKGHIEMTRKIYLEPLKSVLGRSISHYYLCLCVRENICKHMTNPNSQESLEGGENLDSITALLF